MRIGVTENGDPSLHLGWIHEMSSVDAAVIITKNLDYSIRESILQFKEKVIVHATVTGYGGTIIEPNVPCSDQQLNNVADLLRAGFPAQQVVFRIDPIIPTKKGIQQFEDIIKEIACSEEFNEIIRIRISVMDMYKHAKQRFIEIKAYSPLDRIYPRGAFTASDGAFAQVNMETYWLGNQYPDRFHFESCAELKIDFCEAIGCVSQRDIDILGIKESVDLGTKQNRRECQCTLDKVELIRRAPGQCYHGCAYCYWR